MDNPHLPRTSQHARAAARSGSPSDATAPLSSRQVAQGRHHQPDDDRRGRRGARRRRWYRRPGFWLGSIFLALLVAVAAGGAIAYAVSTIPLPGELDTTPTVVIDRNGDEIGELYAEAKREDVELSQMPEHTRDAVLAAEDAEFYDHPGVSVLGIARAAARNVRSGEVRQGGSTISQQYVKVVTGQDDQTAMRKVREAVMAMKLEREVDKDQILEWYLNTIYFGRGAYGIQAASRAYFDVDVSDLTPSQSALLAGFIPAPSASDPVDNPQRAAERYDYVVGQLEQGDFVDAQRAETLRQGMPTVTPKARPRSGTAPFFMAMVEQELARRLGGTQAYRGLEVRTTLDLRMQRAAERTYDEHFDELRDDLRTELGEDVDVPTGAIVSLDPADGTVRALVGGRSFFRDQYNLAIGGPDGQGRQPGSTFKPLALAAWIADGKSPESRFDAPAAIDFSPEESGDPEGWEVNNYGGASYGSMTLREATWNSVNTVYAQVALAVGPERIAELGADAGVTTTLDPNPSIVLGAEEVTPLDLASVYNTLASGGVQHTPRTIASVTRNGETIYEPPDEQQRVLPADVTWTTVDVLRGVVDQGSGTAAAIDRPAAGKTGTTQNAADAWFAGFTPNLTTVVWMGYRDSNEAMPGSPTGGGFPAALWADYMREALDGVPPDDFPPPSGDFEIVGEPVAPSPQPASEPPPQTQAPEPPPQTEAPEPPPQTEAPEPPPAVEQDPPPDPPQDDQPDGGDDEQGGDEAVDQGQDGAPVDDVEPAIAEPLVDDGA